MKAKIRFFARFRELFGTEIIAEAAPGTTLMEFIKQVAAKNKEGNDADLRRTRCVPRVCDPDEEHETCRHR